MQLSLWDNIPSSKWRNFRDASIFVRGLGLSEIHEWDRYITGQYRNLVPLPEDIPYNPDIQYQNSGWESRDDWLGAGENKGKRLNNETGIDTDGNGVLDPDEIQDVEYICHGNDANITLGEPQTGFEAGKIYQAETDGFLFVYYTGGTMFINGFIYSDESENPTTLVGVVGTHPGSIIVPIKKNNYWKVANISYITTIITWTPIL